MRATPRPEVQATPEVITAQNLGAKSTGRIKSQLAIHHPALCRANLVVQGNKL
ncbi:hypothetical protein AZA_24961 [Nitrospirillum viridazoti Y2]|nr:hypothetical protein AZA_24961 [Nitrospirillum amazonense Y2]